MKVSIMQPYFFPYIGYYQLLAASDVFIFLDDANYINRGWINRNNIIVNGQKHMFTVPLHNASQNQLIADLHHAIDDRWRSKFYKTLEASYKKASYYEHAMPLIMEVIENPDSNLLCLTKNSIVSVLDYLGIKPDVKLSSSFDSSKEFKNWERMAALCQLVKADTCVNPIGGQQIYTKEQFEAKGIDFYFLKSRDFKYRQFNNESISGLSMIDVLMFNSPEEIKVQLNQYDVI